MPSSAIVKSKSKKKYIQTIGKDFKCKVILTLSTGKMCTDAGYHTRKELARHMNCHREHRELRKCVRCKYEHYRQDRVTTHQQVRHGIMPSTPDKNPVVLKSEVISPSSPNSSSSDLVIVLDTPVKTRSRTRVAKTQVQKILEYRERNKDRIATF